MRLVFEICPSLLHSQDSVMCRLETCLLVVCRSLADVDVDGRVDRREFSIAMYLIKLCLFVGLLLTSMEMVVSTVGSSLLLCI